MTEQQQQQQLLDLCSDIHRLVRAIDRLLSAQEARDKADCWNYLACAGDRLRAKDRARLWVAEHLKPGDERIPIRPLKAEAEHWVNGPHLSHADFRSVVQEAGYLVEGEFILCSITEGESC